jgi:hypothetical protein
MKISLASSIVGLGLTGLLTLPPLGCSSGSSNNQDAAAGADGAAGHDAAAGSDGAAGSAGTDGAAGADAAAGNDGAAGADAAAGSAGGAGADAAAGSDGGADAGGDGGGTDGPTGDASDGGDGGTVASALETAQLALAASIDLNLLTATHVDTADGDQIPVGWGPRTLPTQQQRDAATALIRRLAALLPGSARNAANTGGYTANDVNVLNGLLTLDANPDDLFSGQSLAPAANTAWDAYKAAAVADTFAPAGLLYLHGVAAGSGDAAFAAYVAGNGTDPEGVVGLSTNIVKAALRHGLEAQLKSF